MHTKHADCVVLACALIVGCLDQCLCETAEESRLRDVLCEAVSPPSMSIDNGATQNLFMALPLVKQTTDYTCGAASLAAVLQGFGFNVTEKQLEIEMNVSHVDGTPFEEIVRASRRRGLLVSVVQWTDFNWMHAVLLRGGVVIVPYQAWLDDDDDDAPIDWPIRWRDGHYSVVLGMDTDNVYLMDPSQNKGHYGYIPKQEFVLRWHDVDGSDDTGKTLMRMGISIERRMHSKTKPLLRIPIPRGAWYTP